MKFFKIQGWKKPYLLWNIILLVIVFAISSFSYANIELPENTYKFAGDYKYPPYEYVNSDGDYLGFNVDIIRAIAENKGINIEIVPMRWSEAVLSLKNGNIDGLIGMSKSNDRKDKYLFIKPTVENEQVIFVKSENVFIKDISDLEGLLVGYQVQDLGMEYINSIENIIRRPYTNQESALIDLSHGKIDAVLADRLVGMYYIQKNRLSEDIKSTGTVLGSFQYGPVVSKDNVELARILEEGLEEIKTNKSYENIHKKWFGESKSSISKFIERNRILVILISSIIILIILFLIAYATILKKQVDKRTKELKRANVDLLENQKEIYNLAYYDPITSLPNRTKFVKELSKVISQIHHKRHIIGVLFLDLDKFKHINDTLGHNVGDQVLRLISWRLKELVGERGSVCKAGGDEYFILLNEIDQKEETEILAKEIIEDFKDPYYVKDYTLYLTISIGISIYPESGLDVENIIKSSDLALYKAKELGGNSYYIYGKEIESKGLDLMQLLNQLRKGIENDELILYYQPQIDIESGRLIGFEALVRWNHPERGLIFPDDFIPLAEESSLIIPMGNCILRKACIQTKEWINAGMDVVVSVNISARQFQHRDFISEVRQVLKDTDLDSKYLAIEITETIAIHNMEYTIEILNELDKLGITVAIDDFGTGYSSLSYLSEMQVDELKIDRSFIWDIEENPKNKSIANAIILLANQLGLKVTAEGVETEEQLNILKAMKCDIAQGYYFSKPVPSEEICNFIKSGFKY